MLGPAPFDVSQNIYPFKILILRRGILSFFALTALIGACPANAQLDWSVGSIRVAPGDKASGFLQVPAGSDGETRIPLTLIHGSRPGPTLALVAGNHGYEYPPVLTTYRLAASVDPKALRGRLILVHIANLPSFVKRTIYYSPVDGKNLNRVYPGKTDGTLSERIAYQITHEVIEKADYLVDMHCGDGNESLATYAYWMPVGNPRVDEAARAMVLATGFRWIVIDRSREKDPAASVYCSNTAMTRGKPAITMELGGLGVATVEQEMADYERSLLSLMRHLQMLEGRAASVQPEWFEPAEVLRFPADSVAKEGLFFPLVNKESRVRKGALLGYVQDLLGRRVFDLRAPFDGTILYIIATPPVTAGEPLAFIGAPARPAP